MGNIYENPNLLKEEE
ncbi:MULTISPECIES: hypothetical protein [unclassified Clostridium]